MNRPTRELTAGLLYGFRANAGPSTRLDIEVDDLTLFGKSVVLRFETGGIGADPTPTDSEWELAGWLLSSLPRLSPWIHAIVSGADGDAVALQKVIEVRIVINRVMQERDGPDSWSLVLVGLEGEDGAMALDFSGTLLLERRFSPAAV